MGFCRYCLNIVLISILLLCAIVTYPSVDISYCMEIPYENVELQKNKADIKLSKYENCPSGIEINRTTIIMTCYAKKKIKKHDSRMRLLMIDISGKKPVILYESNSFGDSDYMHLSVFESKVPSKPLIVMAENGADFSYGIDVFRVYGLHMKYIGYLDVTVDGIDNPASAVPFTKITETNNQFIFTFTKDLLFLEKDGNYKVIPKNQLKFVYDGKKMIKLTNKSKSSK